MDPEPARDAVRRSYDAVAEEYAARLGDELRHKPLDRALLAAVMEEAGDDQPVADVGCGPGHVAGWLAARGAAVVGVDVSPRMVAVARRRHPDVDFREGDLTQLPARDGEFGAVVALYAVIHLASHEVRVALDEFRRVLRPGGVLLVAFHVGAETRHLTEWWGHEVDLDFRFLEPDAIARLLADAGFAVTASLVRDAYPQEVETRRAYLLARRGP